MAGKLDRKRPFAEVFGENIDHKYLQDDKRFDHEGLEIGGDGKVDRSEKQDKSAKIAKAVADQVSAQMQALQG
jgi:hypothetical protein